MKERTSFSTQQEWNSTLAFPFEDDEVDVNAQCTVMQCIVPTSVPKSHFDITSYKEQTVNKGKDTSNGKDTNGKEAL